MYYCKRLFGYIRPYIWYVVLGTIFAIINIGANTLNPYITKRVVDDGLLKNNGSQLVWWLMMLFISVLFRAGFHYLRECMFHFISQKVLYQLRSDLYDKLQAQSFAFYDKVRTGVLMNRMVGDLESIRTFIHQSYILLLEAVIAIILAFYFMFTMNLELSLAVLSITPFMYFNTRNMSRALKPSYVAVRKAFEKLTSGVQESITGIRVVKSLGKEQREMNKFLKIAKDFTDANIKAAEVQAKYTPFAPFINGVGTVIILLVGGYLVIKGKTSIGTVVAFNSYIVQLNFPMATFSNVINQWQNATSSLEKIYELLDEEPEIKNKKNALIPKKINGDIVFRKVGFKYSDRMVLENINLHMKTGSITAIMGATGSGKSTLINLIGRFYDCTEGKILIDGYDIKDLDLHTLRKNIGIILQETFLFSDTIAANIAFAKPDATREEIEEAARIADAHDFIIKMPNGYDTVIGERGVGLSGGQKQRIAIARAILSNPRILILDDATSSVDMETEHEIQEALKKVMKGRTTIIIAHRISSVKEADQIIVLEEGKIIERGTHEELLQLKGQYYRTFMEQYGQYKEKEWEKGVEKYA